MSDCEQNPGMDLAAANTLSNFAYFATWSWFIATAIMLSRVDFRERRLPNTVVLIAYLGGLLGFTVIAFSRADFTLLVNAALGSVIASLGYLMIHLFGRMGMGDVKYAGVIGLYLGSLGWTYLYLGSLISFVGAALWVLPQMLSNRENRSVPFGPFMALGVVASGFIAIGVTAGA